MQNPHLKSPAPTLFAPVVISGSNTGNNKTCSLLVWTTSLLYIFRADNSNNLAAKSEDSRQPKCKYNHRNCVWYHWKSSDGGNLPHKIVSLCPRFRWLCSNGRRKSPGSWSLPASTSRSSRQTTTSKDNGTDWSSTLRELIATLSSSSKVLPSFN